ncbi:MAG TPA: citrate/2-methylcitrate synthase [Trebonia sp.]|jgi:citrate synthase
MTQLIEAPAGLKGVAVTDTAIGDVRGAEGFYHYRQYDATKLARDRTFEDVWHLLHVGDLPDDARRADFAKRAAARRAIPGKVAGVLPAIAALAADDAPLAAPRAAYRAGRARAADGSLAGHQRRQPR